MVRDKKKVSRDAMSNEKLKKVVGGGLLDYMMFCSVCHHTTWWSVKAMNVECPNCHIPDSFSWNGLWSG